MKKTKALTTATLLTQVGRAPEEHYGFVNTPIYRGSTVLFKNMDDFVNKRGRYEYGRRGNPNSEALSNAWCEISGAAGAVSVPSGLAAVSLALLSCLKPGDHILVTDSVYLPTRKLCDIFFKRYGIETTFYDPLINAGIEKLFKTNTKAVYTESPGSLTFEVQDIPAIAKIAHAQDAVVLMDNTWATPLFFQAHKHGVDICIEAGTKYLVGHSDALIGLVSANEKCWPAIEEAYGLLGICAGPEDMFLSLRGLRTMSVRLKHQEKIALDIARWLAERPEVARVLHPALPSCPGHEIWKRDFSGSSGVFSVELKEAPQKAVAAMIDGLALFGIGASWGGYESLIIPFNCSYRVKAPAKAPYLRLQIGLEDEQDLIADLEAGFARLAKLKNEL
jgi:cystathionine beta-lyase